MIIHPIYCNILSSEERWQLRVEGSSLVAVAVEVDGITQRTGGRGANAPPSLCGSAGGWRLRGAERRLQTAGGSLSPQRFMIVIDRSDS
jgi:hypothetical protein